MSRRSKPAEAVSGSYTPVPHAVLDSAAFIGASDRAKAMLFELIRQHNGRNNGQMQLSTDWLRRRGWSSTDQAQKAKAELLARSLAVKTRTGGLRMGPDRFAMTWLPITDFAGLDIKPGQFHPGAWREMDPVPALKKRDDQSATRNRPVPPHGTGDAAPVPPHGTVEAVFGQFPVPPHGNNESCQFTASNSSAVCPDDWLAAELTRLASVGLTGRQCFQVPPSPLSH